MKFFIHCLLFLQVSVIFAASSWIGETIVDFEAPNLEDKSIETELLRKDKVFLIKMGRLDCGACHMALQVLGRIDKEYQKKGVEFLDVSFTTDKQGLKALANKYDVDFDTVIDDHGALGRYYGVTYIPVLIIAAADGKIVDYLVGAVSEKQIRASLDKALSLK
jgi:thiol-disulfide isomerase/thioredoxin